MGAKSGFALKLLQWFIRGVQFCCCALILALFSYFLAVAAQNNFQIPTWTRAVEGISGIGVVYTALGLLMLCCLAGHPFSSFIAIVLDIAFVGAFIYVAVTNKTGASSCTGPDLETPFGTGDGTTQISEGLPTFRTLCQMQTACFAVSIVAILFFILSALVEFVLVRHRRKEARFGPSPANNYTSGYGRRGIFGLFRRKKTADTTDANALPEFTHPEQVRQSYNTEATAVDHEPAGYNKYGNNGFTHDGATAYPDSGTAQGVSQPAGYGYGR